MEVASEAMITRNITNRAVENGKALIDLTQNHGWHGISITVEKSYTTDYGMKWE